jgi:hypothetical protein
LDGAGLFLAFLKKGESLTSGDGKKRRECQKASAKYHIPIDVVDECHDPNAHTACFI